MSATATATKTESKDKSNKEQAKAALEALEGTCGGVVGGEVSRARQCMRLWIATSLGDARLFRSCGYDSPLRSPFVSCAYAYLYLSL
jgi:hypothetical protein